MGISLTITDSSFEITVDPVEYQSGVVVVISREGEHPYFSYNFEPLEDGQGFISVPRKKLPSGHYTITVEQRKEVGLGVEEVVASASAGLEEQ